MQPRHFEFLRSKYPEWAEIAGLAEEYAPLDSSRSLHHQERLLAYLAFALYERASWPLPPLSGLHEALVSRPVLHELLSTEEFHEALPPVILQKFSAISKATAVSSSGPASSPLASASLQQLFDLTQWFFFFTQEKTPTQTEAFSSPPLAPPTKKEKQQLLERLRLAEKRIETLERDLDAKIKPPSSRHPASPLSKEDREKQKEKGQKVAYLLHFNEQATRRHLIDQQLRIAGWKVGDEGQDTEDVRQEVSLSTRPTDSKKERGRADYVLYNDDGKPLAVIEAKRTSVDPKEGATQAELYAQGLLQETGIEPVLFFTNGLETWLWDRTQGEPYRKVYGFYSKDSLAYLLYQRSHKRPLSSIPPDPTIAGRKYQIEAIQRVCEHFSEHHRKALLVQATGTGKTRVAVSLSQRLMRAGWAKRILFLCDRRELRKQADQAFKEFLPSEPRVVIESSTSYDRDKRIYLATYPAMMTCFERFDVGFFDLVIADESHRSLYKKYRSLFQYFDALHLGLTATPLRFVDRDTYKTFGCGEGEPTYAFSYEDALQSQPPVLVPFRVYRCQTQLRRDGLSYAKMTPEQQKQIEEQDPMAQEVNYSPEDLDRLFFNKETTRLVWRRLMEDGIRESTGSRVGKTIVFARDHAHAVHLSDVFTELYPQYGSSFCRVIDSHVGRADTLIDHFKNAAHELTIAISVDMLDTGIDISQVVNLVFVKPVRSYVKFWQMIGRGTRLCPDLFGPGKDKTEFLIFDHGENFAFFELAHQEAKPSKQESLLEKLFKARIELVFLAQEKKQEDAFRKGADLLVQDLQALLTTKAFDVRDRHKEIELLAKELEEVVQDTGFRTLSNERKRDLLNLAPFHELRPLRGDEEEFRFDLLIARLGLESLRGTPDVQALRTHLEREVGRLVPSQNPVKAKASTLQKLQTTAFWDNLTFQSLEEIRRTLRDVMKYKQESRRESLSPRSFDITDTEFIPEISVPRLEGLDEVAYKARVKSSLQTHLAAHPTIRRIQQGEAAVDPELQTLADLLLAHDSKADLRPLQGASLKGQRSLLTIFRESLGLEEAAVKKAFASFVQNRPQLTLKQRSFLQLLQTHLTRNGCIDVERLYEPPFTTLHAESIDGVFSKIEDVEEIFSILRAFQPVYLPPLASSDTTPDE